VKTATARNDEHPSKTDALSFKPTYAQTATSFTAALPWRGDAKKLSGCPNVGTAPEFFWQQFDCHPLTARVKVRFEQTTEVRRSRMGSL